MALKINATYTPVDHADRRTIHHRHYDFSDR